MTTPPAEHEQTLEELFSRSDRPAPDAADPGVETAAVPPSGTD